MLPLLAGPVTEDGLVQEGQQQCSCCAEDPHIQRALSAYVSPSVSQEQHVGTPAGMDILPRLIQKSFPAHVNSLPLEICQHLMQRKAKQGGSGREIFRIWGTCITQ